MEYEYANILENTAMTQQVYLKLDTMEFPVYPGDVALGNAEDFVEVEWCEPDPIDLYEYDYVIGTEQTNGKWKVTWSVVAKPPEEVERIKALVAEEIDPRKINRPGSAPNVIG